MEQPPADNWVASRSSEPPCADPLNRWVGTEWWKLLSVDARIHAVGLANLLPLPLYQLGIDRVRRLSFPTTPEGPVMERVHDVIIDRGVSVRVYRPGAIDTHTRPAVVYMHGGGFCFGSVDGVDALCRRLAYTTSSVVVSVNYRLSPEYPFPAPVLDCISAARWTSDHAVELGARKDLVLAGDSAGATLALTIAHALNGSGPRVAGMVLAYPAVTESQTAPSWREFADAPVITAPDCAWTWSMYLCDRRRLGAIHAVPADTADWSFLPETYVVTAEVDVLRDDAEAFTQLLRAQGVAARLNRVRGVFHGFFTEVGLIEQADVAVNDCAQFIRALP